MDWLEIHLDTVHRGLDGVEAFLSSHGVDGVVIDDEEDFHDFLENNHEYWDYVDEDLENSMKGKSRVTFYLEANEAGFAKMGEIRIALQDLRQRHPEYGTLLMSLENLKDSDWENNWRQYYKPMEIGERLLVIPEWEQESVAGQKKYEGRVPLILEPGLTFGTGSHATTRLCLKFLEKVIHGQEHVLDLGCGSGILSIAALCLGAKDAFAVDIDDKCKTIAYENAALNGIHEDQYQVLIGDVTSDAKLQSKIGGQYDVILSNIVADVIISLSTFVPSLLKEGGTWICSGIIDTRAEEVKNKILEAGWTVDETATSEGWYSFCCSRKKV